MLYRKKPIPVEALQWTGSNVDEMTAFAGFSFTPVDVEDREDDPDMTGSVFDSLHSTWIPLCDGDYVLRGIKGEFYPCKRDMFLESYEAVE